tara:strand:- start:60 stop:293 length:234 start_codon:yes stop_codon:yes gene_type:complete
MKVNDNLLIENAILAFLHHYPEHEWSLLYGELLTRVRKLQNEQPKTNTVQKRGRPAKRQRTKKAASPATSKEAVETT